MSGTLVIEDPRGQRSAVLLRSGTPVKCKIAAQRHYLAELLQEQDLLDVHTAEHTLAHAQAQGALHGQVLLEEGLIDERQLREALSEQLIRKVGWLFSLESGSYGFYEQDFLAGYAGSDPIAADPWEVIWRGITDQMGSAPIRATLGRLGSAYLRFGGKKQFSRLRLSRAEQALVEVLRARPHTLQEVLATELLAPERLEMLVYFLLVTQMVEATVRPPVNPTPRTLQTPPVPSPPKPASSPEDTAFRNAVSELSEALEQHDYYELLGVPRNAEAAEIEAAYFALAKRWHPDRIPKSLRDLQGKVTRIFAKMTEAQRTLADPEARQAYDKRLLEGESAESEQARVRQVLEAASAHQKAEILLKRNALPAAELEARRAVEGDPEQAGYLALFAWIQGLRRPIVEPVADLLELLDQAVARDPSNERARYYRGQLRKRSGQLEEAMSDFRWVVEHNPRNLDAERELHLYARRREAQKKSEKSKAGVLGRWLKRES